MMSTASEMVARTWSWKWKHPDIIRTCLWQNSGMIIHENKAISKIGEHRNRRTHRRAQESAGEPRRAQESTAEHSRAQGSSGERRGAQESAGEHRGEHRRAQASAAEGIH